MIEKAKEFNRLHIRPHLQALRRNGNAFFVSLLLKSLQKLDPSFRQNLRADSFSNAFEPISNVPDSATSSSASRQVDEGSTLVLNEGGIIAGPVLLQWVLKAIFDSFTFNAFQEHIYSDMLNRQNAWPSLNAVVSFLLDYLQGCLEKRENREEAANLLEMVKRFEKSIADNRSAYSRSGKPNPNAVFWPDPTIPKWNQSLFRELPYASTFPILDSSTPIGSAGSCFAVEIAYRLQANKFNYVVTESNPDPVSGFSPACARWGTIFNTLSFRQLIEKAFGAASLPRVVFSEKVNDNIVFIDVFREGSAYNSIEDYENDYARHVEAARSALLQCEVFIMTLGMNEVWYLRSGHALSRLPLDLSLGLVRSQVLSVGDNLAELQRMLDVWRHHNPRLKLILSVSPVPLNATFRSKEMHVVPANCHSKSVLRVAAEEFCRRNRDVFYFPSYESVLYCTEQPWQADQRHVSKEAVDKVMQLFDRIYLKPTNSMKNPPLVTA